MPIGYRVYLREWLQEEVRTNQEEFERVLKLNHVINSLDIKAKKGLHRSMIDKFEAVCEFLYKLCIVLRFSEHEDVVNIDCNKYFSFV